MTALNETLRLLLNGQFICPVAYAAHYDYLCEEANAQSAQAFLQNLGNRLARTSPEGAFFMAPCEVGSSEVDRLRDDLLKFRDIYGHLVQMLDFIRQGNEDFRLQPGECVQLANLEAEVNNASTLESQLRQMAPLIRSAQIRSSNRDILEKLLEHLKNDGYLKLLSASTGTYIATGKMEHLHAVIALIKEHQPADLSVIPSTEPSGESSTSDLFQGGDAGEPHGVQS